MKHFSANLEQSVTIDNGNITVTAGDSFISENTTKTGANRAIQLLGTNTEYVDGTGAFVSNNAFDAVSFATDTGILTLSRIDGSTAATVTIDTGTDTNPEAGHIPIAVTTTAGYSGTGATFADSSLSQSAVNGVVTAENGFAVTGALTVSTTATVGTDLTVNGSTTLGDAGADSVTVTSVGGSGTGIVTSTSAGVLQRITTIPESFLPNISIGDVFTYRSEATNKATADANFFAETEHYAVATPIVSGRVYTEQPYHRGDIAIITYDPDDDDTFVGTSVLIYVGEAQAAGTTGAGFSTYPASASGDWHDISISATGIMDLFVTAPITSTGGTSPTIGVNTGAVVNGGPGLSTQDQIFDFVTGRSLLFSGDIAFTTDPTTAVNISGTGATALAVSLADDVVDVAEINAPVNASPSLDGGKVLALNSSGNGLEWVTNGSGVVNKLTDTFSNSSSGAIDIGSSTAVGSAGGIVTVQVYEVSTGSLNQIIPDSIVINTATSGSETVTITVGTAAAGSITAYRYVITG